MNPTFLLLLAGCPPDEVKFAGDDDTGAGSTAAAETDTAPDSDTDTDTATDTDTDTSAIRTDTGGPDTGGIDTGAATYVPTDFTVADADLVLVGTWLYGYSGSSVSGAGDLDGDGISDLVVGAYNESVGAEHAGAAYLVTAADLAAADPTVDQELPTIGHQVSGNGSYSGAGSTVAGGEDVDGDGLSDVLVAAFHNPADTGFNGVHVLSAPSPGAGGSSSVDDALSTFACDDSGWGGTAAFAGDLDADGRTDVAVGCPGDGAGGSVYVFDGGSAGPHGRSDATSAYEYSVDGYYGGSILAPLGDVDGDGIEDLGVGGYAHDSEGTFGYAWVLVDHAAGAYRLEDQAHTLRGESIGDYAGTSTAGAGDADGDGLDDVLVAVPHSDLGADNGGAVSLLSGVAWTAGAETTLPDAVTATLYGEAVDGGAGADLASAGDIDGDGQRDFLLRGWDATGWLLYGPLPTGTVPLGSVAEHITGMAMFGGAGAGIGDVNGDGVDDFAVMDPDADTTTVGGGKTYIYFGGAR
jgi:hypothetical protein